MVCTTQLGVILPMVSPCTEITVGGTSRWTGEGLTLVRRLTTSQFRYIISVLIKCTSGANGQIAWTKEYQRFFDGADLNINRATENLVAVPGHRGPHPIEYHQYVYGSLEQATKGLAPGTPAYKAAVTKTLDGIKKEAVIVGSEINKWLTRN